MCKYLEIVRCVVCKQKTAYEMRISDWSSDVCSSDLFGFYRRPVVFLPDDHAHHAHARRACRCPGWQAALAVHQHRGLRPGYFTAGIRGSRRHCLGPFRTCLVQLLLLCSSEEHTSELQSLMRISSAVFCLDKTRTEII